MNAQPAANTVTDPFWADIVVAAFLVFCAITIVVAIHATARALIRHWRQAQLEVDHKLARGLAEVDLARWEREIGGVR